MNEKMECSCKAARCLSDKQRSERKKMEGGRREKIVLLVASTSCIASSKRSSLLGLFELMQTLRSKALHSFVLRANNPNQFNPN